MAKQTYDVVIIGGAMMGSSVSWWLRHLGDFDGSIAIIEADPTFSTASTSHTNSCIRQQFGSEINIRISQFSSDFINDFKSLMGQGAPSIPIQSFGYLYFATTNDGAETLKHKVKIQQTLGAGTQLYTADELVEKFPFYTLDDIVLASHNTQNEGYFDGGTIFDYFRKAPNITRLKGRVTSITTSSQRIDHLTLETGESIAAGQVVNAAGPRATQVMDMIGLPMPIEPRKRFTWVFEAADPLPCDLPLTIDPSGVHFRTDGRYYMAGCAPLDDKAVAFDDFAMDHSLWQDHVWPIIATRIPQFERLRVVQEWAGHYAYNTVDQNAIIGKHPDIDNLFLINGFSGHGLQQAPAVGRGLAELIATGAYRSLDLSPLNMERILEGRPLREQNVI